MLKNDAPLVGWVGVVWENGGHYPPKKYIKKILFSCSFLQLFEIG